MRWLAALTGFGCVGIGVLMMYQSLTVTINQISLSAGLILLIVGLILIIIAVERSVRTISQNQKGIRQLFTIPIVSGIMVFLIYCGIIFFLFYSLRGKGPLGIVNVNQYEVFVDLLTILLTLLGVISVGSYVLIRHFVLEKVRDEIKTEIDRVKGEVKTVLEQVKTDQEKLKGEVKIPAAEAWRSFNIDLGLLYYVLAESLSMPENWKNQMKEKAVTLTIKSLKEEVEMSPTIREYNLLTAKNNIAYYWASIHEQQGRCRWDLKKKAEEYAEEARSRFKTGDRLLENPELLETYAFVKARFAQTVQEKNEVKKIIEALLANPDLASKEKSLKQSLEWLDKLTF
jgi:hypothetical protein